MSLKGDDNMIKKIAWDMFKNTGDINSFLEFKQIEDAQKNLNNTVYIDEIKKIQEITNIGVENKKDKQKGKKWQQQKYME